MTQPVTTHSPPVSCPPGWRLPFGTGEFDREPHELLAREAVALEVLSPLRRRGRAGASRADRRHWRSLTRWSSRWTRPSRSSS